MDGRSGVSYKIKISDGQDTLELPVSSPEVWNMFAPFGYYQVNMETSQVANDNRISTRSRVVNVKEVEQ